MKIEVKVNKKKYEFTIKKNNGNFVWEKGDEKILITLSQLNEYEFLLEKENEKRYFVADKFNRNNNIITVNNCNWEITAVDSRRNILRSSVLDENKISSIKSSMPGKIISVLVKTKDEVEKDQPLIVMEAMKMENMIKSPKSGKIKKILVKSGDSVDTNEILLEFE